MIELELDDLFEEPEIEEAADIPEAEEVPERQEEKNAANTSVEVKKKVRRPQLKLDADRLCGPRGISVIPNLFENVKFKGKKHEFEDLDKMMKTLEHWAHRMYPKMTFDDCLQQIEKLGTKRPVQTNIKKFRMDMLTTPEETTVRNDDVAVDDEDKEFDNLLADSQVIAINPPSPVFNSSITNANAELSSNDVSIPMLNKSMELTNEQRARMEEKRRIAEEKRKLLKEKAQLAAESQSQSIELPVAVNDNEKTTTSEIEQRSIMSDNYEITDAEIQNGSKEEDMDVTTNNPINNESNEVLNESNLLERQTEAEKVLSKLIKDIDESENLDLR